MSKDVELKEVPLDSCWLVIDSILKKPYVNDRKRSFVFYDKGALVEFVQKYENLSSMEVKVGLRKIKSLCYASGAETLSIVTSDSKVDEYLQKKDLERSYYNNKLSLYLALMAHKNKKLDIFELATCKFIVAVHIDKTRDEYMLYASAKLDNKKNFFIAFSDLMEFYLWSEKYGKKYKPLEVDFLGFHRIGGRDGFIINPMSSRFYISPKFIDKVYKEVLGRKTKENEKGDEEKC